MELIEIRDLDGPGLFAPYPVVKIEVRLDSDETVPAATRESIARAFEVQVSEVPVEALTALVAVFHERTGLVVPDIDTRPLDTAGHVAVYFAWEWRSAALAIARAACDALAGSVATDAVQVIREALSQDRADDDRPLWVRDDQRHIPAVGITGTNGKTTTTRLLAHILRQSGQHVGWSSSSGVYIDDEQVIEGDYTGPAGARRVLQDPVVETAVLETARGGILLRGLAYESNDVGVFLNVTADHLDMQGVERIETLAEVKGIVVRVTRPGGVVVLNADDPLVLAERAQIRAELLLFSVNPESEAVREHVLAGGRAVVCDGRTISHWSAGHEMVLTQLHDVPMTFDGAAAHMVENALAATGAALGLGIPVAQIREGLRTFRSDLRSNAGRLNVFRIDGRIVVVDYAHNESGLEALLRFTRTLMPVGGRLVAIVGTAGDRQDSVLAGLGQIAARDADVVIPKENPKYLRGRTMGEQTRIIHDAVTAAGAGERIAGTFLSELEAFVASLDVTTAGDAIAVMCVEEQLSIYRELRDRGAEEW